MRIDNLTFSYGDKMIFDNFSLEIPDEGITALSGPSGCGKTTLMRLIAGLERPDMGRSDDMEMANDAQKYGRTEVTNDPQKCGIIKKNGSLLPASKIAVMFQEDRLLPGIAAKKQLEIAVPGCDAEGWLKAVGLENESNTVPEKLSGGMKRRLSLVRCLAFAQDKELILLDEPFTGVDPDRIAGISETIRKMRMPIIVTGHTEETLKLADRVILLDNRQE